MSARSRPVDISDLKVYRPPSNQEQEISLDDVIEKIKTGMPSFKGGTGVVIVLAVLVLAVGWAATGFYQVRPAELAALQLFGKWDGKLQGPGLHWLWPSPVGTRNIEAVTETRRMELGFRSTESGSLVSSPNEALMITGDLNIADVQMVIQYRIKDLASFLFRVGDPGDPTRGVVAGSPEGLTLKDATEAALRQVVGQRSIDDVLTINKEAVQVDTQSLLQSILDNYKTGISIKMVQLQSVLPPQPVADSYNEVVRAEQEEEKLENEANQAFNKEIYRAKGEAKKLINEAKGYSVERINTAKGDAALFELVLAEYKKAPEITKDRYYIEAMNDIYSKSNNKVIVDNRLENFLPMMNLKNKEGK